MIAIIREPKAAVPEWYIREVVMARRTVLLPIPVFLSRVKYHVATAIATTICSHRYFSIAASTIVDT